MKHLLTLVMIFIVVDANVKGLDIRFTTTSSDTQKWCLETCTKPNITCNLTGIECTDSESANASHVQFMTTSNGAETLCLETCTNLNMSCNLTSIECTESKSARRSHGSPKGWGYPGKRRRSLYDKPVIFSSIMKEKIINWNKELTLRSICDECQRIGLKCNNTAKIFCYDPAGDIPYACFGYHGNRL